MAKIARKAFKNRSPEFIYRAIKMMINSGKTYTMAHMQCGAATLYRAMSAAEIKEEDSAEEMFAKIEEYRVKHGIKLEEEPAPEPFSGRHENGLEPVKEPVKKVESEDEKTAFELLKDMTAMSESLQKKCQFYEKACLDLNEYIIYLQRTIGNKIKYYTNRCEARLDPNNERIEEIDFKPLFGN